MMTSTSELSFDFKPHIYSMLLKSSGDQTSDQQTHNLEEFLARLEEERLKIDVFKRELPLCMQLLNNAMEAYRQELQSQRTNQGASRPVLEEFIPLKNTSSSQEVTDNNNLSSDKANWMTSAQLWNQESHDQQGANKALEKSPLITSPQEADINLALNGKQRINGGNGGAFIPFSSKDRGVFPELALASSHKEEEIVLEDQKKCGNSEKDRASLTGNNSNNNTSSQNQRKARRCWSPDLHRRFVNALHMLGGSQVATPKQIRELMKVDGLTNDEVKSHLQKYRLHTRRPSPSPQASVNATPQVVFLGGIWVPPEYAAAAAAQGGAQAAALYGAHAATAHHVSPPFCSTAQPVAQEMYPTLPPPANHHHQMIHQQFHVYNKPPLTQRNSSPGSDIQGGGGGGDRSESIEYGKSESSSWKGDSGGENGGDRRRVVECEESNASVVTLKF